MKGVGWGGVGWVGGDSVSGGEGAEGGLEALGWGRGRGEEKRETC